MLRASAIIITMTSVCASACNSNDCYQTATCPIADDGGAAVLTDADAGDAARLDGVPPRIVSIDTTFGDTGGGTPIKIVGERFEPGATVTVGGVPLTNLVVNPTAITGVTGPHPKGVVDVVVRNQGGGSATAAAAFEYFNPTAISDCIWWLRADLGVTTENGEVTKWVDQSGLNDPGRDAVPDATERPAHNGSDPTYHGKATIGTFSKASTGGDCRLRTAPWNFIYSANGTTKALTLAAVGHAPADNSRYLTAASGSDLLALMSWTGNPAVRAGAGTHLLRATELQLDTPKTFVMAEFHGPASKLFVNATVTATQTGDLGTATTLGDEGMFVGSYPGRPSSTFGAERIAEVFAYSRILTEEERVKLRTYLNGRYETTMDR